MELAGRASHHRGLEREAVPLLRSLAREVRLTCHLGILDGTEAVYLARVPFDSDIVVKSWVGKRFPLHSSALGKVLLAWLPDPELDEMIKLIAFEARMPNTITDAAIFRDHLGLVRKRGWATDDEKQAPDLRCISAPVRDQNNNVAAAVSAVGTTTQIGSRKPASRTRTGCALPRTARCSSWS
ncbi:IclR family transcriptional regulator [Lichenicoccus sp.]|uniref:IclR family transcriptional regulator n=1 Tax=Lichenicoccus sp. TaxID=2781899 RepID=UPI003D10D836